MSITVTETSKGTYLNIRGRAQWPKLTTPDTHFDAAGVFSTKLILTEEDRAELQTLLEDAQEQAVQIAVDEAATKGRKVKPETIKRVDLPLQEIVDRETGEGTGEWVVSTKCKASGTTKDGRSWARKVPLYDSKTKPIENPKLEIWSGSVLNCRVLVKPFYTAGLGAGVSLPLQGVQILQLASGARTAADMGFGAEEDGYAYEDMAEGELPWSSTDEDATGESADF